ncbi:FAD-binding oxidoreductase, partial [Jannaschia sp.]|nr:FAD-binding oxidoreductase [Jannaschia sp.]
MSDWLHANGDAGVWPATWYTEGVSLPDPHPPLTGERNVDLCVVGGGITGLSAALHAAQAGMSVIVLEAQRVGWGASGRNGGQIGSGFNWDQAKLKARLGRDARPLWALAEEAKALTTRLIALHAPDADYRPGVLSACLRARDLPGYAEHATRMDQDYGTKLAVLDRAGVSSRIGTTTYAGGLLDMSAGYCNPLAYTLGLARAAAEAGVTICERSEVVRLGNGVETREGRVSARFMVQATNGYGPGLTARTGARVLPINNYIAVTEPLGAPVMADPVAVADSRVVVNYFWQTRDFRLVYGGGESYGKRFPRDIASRVRANMSRVYPELTDVRFSHAWGGTLAVTATRLPYVDEVAPGVFSAGGYSGHGLALS